MNGQKKRCFLFIFLAGFQLVSAQNAIDSFLTPADSLNTKRQNSVFISEAVLASVALVGLNELWYADYPKSDFHFILCTAAVRIIANFFLEMHDAEVR